MECVEGTEGWLNICQLTPSTHLQRTKYKIVFYTSRWSQFFTLVCSQDCRNEAHLAPGTTNSVKLSRYFDKVRKWSMVPQKWWLSEICQEKLFGGCFGSSAQIWLLNVMWPWEIRVCRKMWRHCSGHVYLCVWTWSCSLFIPFPTPLEQVGVLFLSHAFMQDMNVYLIRLVAYQYSILHQASA